MQSFYHTLFQQERQVRGNRQLTEATNSDHASRLAPRMKAIASASAFVIAHVASTAKRLPRRWRSRAGSRGLGATFHVGSNRIKCDFVMRLGRISVGTTGTIAEACTSSVTRSSN